MTTTPITGECLCGSVKYRLDGPLRDGRSCHCSRCRKAFSAACSAYALCDAADFQWTQGAELLTAYGKKDGIGLRFCRVCGSTICAADGSGAVKGVVLGCVNGNPAIEIGMHIYVDSKASWEVMPEGVTTFAGAAPTAK